jgi:hypothetical protein
VQVGNAYTLTKEVCNCQRGPCPTGSRCHLALAGAWSAPEGRGRCGGRSREGNGVWLGRCQNLDRWWPPPAVAAELNRTESRRGSQVKSPTSPTPGYPPSSALRGVALPFCWQHRSIPRMMHAIVTDDQRVTRSCLLLFIDRVRFLFVSYRAPSERGVKSITPDTRESERASSEVLLKLLLRCASHVARLPSPSASVSIGVKEKTTLCFAFGCAMAGRDGDPATRASNALARVCAPMVERGASCNLERARRGNQRDNGLLHQS